MPGRWMQIARGALHVALIAVLLCGSAEGSAASDEAAVDAPEAPLASSRVPSAGELAEELRALRAEVRAAQQTLVEQSKLVQAVVAQSEELQKRFDRCGCDADRALGDGVEGGGDADDGEDEVGGVSEDSTSSTGGGRGVGDTSMVLTVDIQDEAWVKEVFFGGRRVHFSTRTGADDIPDVFEEAAFEMRANATFGTLACWERLKYSKKTLAQRFHLPKPPVTFVVANGDPPVMLDMAGAVKPWQLVRKAAPHLGVQVTRIDGLARFKSLCSQRKACLVVCFQTQQALVAATATLSPLLERHRELRAVALNITDWRLRLEDQLERKRPVVGSAVAAFLCLARTGTTGSGRGGAFFHGASDQHGLHELELFLGRCGEGRDLVTIEKAPWISHRPGAGAREAPRPRPSSSSRPAPSPSPAAKAGRTRGGASSGRAVDDLEIKDEPVRSYSSSSSEEEDLFGL